MDALISEQRLLRSEAQDLKRCQLQYFVLSITGTGSLLGLARVFSVDHAGAVMLAPLTILLPCWLLFFDKATTLTRLTGYLRILEDIIGRKFGVTPIHLGYENALANFRDEEERNGPQISTARRKGELWRMLWLGTRHRFWMINWYTFCVLSLVCCGAAYLWNRTQPCPNPNFYYVIYGVAVLVVICGSYTAWLIYQLTFGKYSYNHVAAFWKTIMPSHNRTANPP